MASMTQGADERDYMAEIRHAIETERKAHEGLPAPIVAQRIVQHLLDHDPELLSGWLQTNAANFVRDTISAIDRSTRAYNRRVAGRAEFAEQVTDGESAIRWLNSNYVVDEHGGRLPLRHMRARHLAYVATGYEQDETTARFEAAFFRAVAKKVGFDEVQDHFTEDAILALRRSIARREQSGAQHQRGA